MPGVKILFTKLCCSDVDSKPNLHCTNHSNLVFLCNTITVLEGDWEVHMCCTAVACHYIARLQWV
jgi:hypothetical protein